jgi:hypothetical protein
VNACRICVVEFDGARVLVLARRKTDGRLPASASEAQPKVVLDAASSVDLSTTPDVRPLDRRIRRETARFGPTARRRRRHARRRRSRTSRTADPLTLPTTVAEPTKIDNIPRARLREVHFAARCRGLRSRSP